MRNDVATLYLAEQELGMARHRLALQTERLKDVPWPQEEKDVLTANHRENVIKLEAAYNELCLENRHGLKLVVDNTAQPSVKAKVHDRKAPQPHPPMPEASNDKA